jgi:hypothetical protein
VVEEKGRRISLPPEELARRPEVDFVSTTPEEADLTRARRARTVRRVFLTLLAAFIALGAAGRLGVRTATVTARGGGYELTVTYGQVSRPGLPTPWSFVVRRAGGFDGPVTVVATHKYLDMFDENGFDPEPSSSTATEQYIVWEFEPPPGDTLAVSLDARIEPSVQWGRSGETAVVENGRQVVVARYKTWIMP